MWFYQNPQPSSPAIENDWSLERSQSQERVVPNILKLLRNTNFLLGRGGKGVYTTFSKDYTINLNNFREYFKEQWVDKTSCSNLLIFSVSFLSKSSMSSWVCLVFLFRLLTSLLNVMVVSPYCCQLVNMANCFIQLLCYILNLLGMISEFFKYLFQLLLIACSFDGCRDLVAEIF